MTVRKMKALPQDVELKQAPAKQGPQKPQVRQALQVNNCGPQQVEPNEPVPSPPLEQALNNLEATVSGAHGNLSYLYDTLEPFLPRHLFDSEGADDEAKELLEYPEHDHNMSATVLSIHKALNELNRLQQRIMFINSHIVR